MNSSVQKVSQRGFVWTVASEDVAHRFLGVQTTGVLYYLTVHRVVKSHQTTNLKIFFFWNKLLFLAKSTSQSVIFFLVIFDIFHALFCKWLFTAIVFCWWNGSYHSGRNRKHQDYTPSCTGRNNMKYHTLMIRLVFTNDGVRVGRALATV